MWGSIGSGYCIYGWRQQSLMPFLGGVAMTAASIFLPALPMSIVCAILMIAVYWLMKNGY